MKANLSKLSWLLLAIVAFSSCKQSTSESITTNIVDGDTTTVVTTTTTSTGIEIDSAKARWDRAKANLKNAVDHGDSTAKAAAQKTADDAEIAWNNLKANVRESRDNTKVKLDETKHDIKENYNEVLENAKAK